MSVMMKTLGDTILMGFVYDVSSKQLWFVLLELRPLDQEPSLPSVLLLDLEWKSEESVSLFASVG